MTDLTIDVPKETRKTQRLTIADGLFILVGVATKDTLIFKEKVTVQTFEVFSLQCINFFVLKTSKVSRETERLQEKRYN